MRRDGWETLPSLTETQRQHLTLKCEMFNGDAFDVRLYREENGVVYIPRTLRDHPNYEVTGPNRTAGEALPDLLPIALREDQLAPAAKLHKTLHYDKGAILEAGCGFGKTVVALEVIRRLGRVTVVLVHKEFLMDQWAERIAQFLPEATVGFWRGDTCDTASDIVIGMVQSISRGGYTKKGVFTDYPDRAYDRAGLVVMDECHVAAAPSFVDAIGQFKSMYRLGLTAEPIRRDRLERVFYSHIGPIAHTVKGVMQKARVATIFTKTFFTEKSYRMYTGDPNTAKLITMVSKDTARTRMIVDEVVKATRAGRRPLVLTDRRDHVDLMVAMFKSSCPEFTVSKFVGGMKKEKQQNAMLADVLIGTYSMADTGLDIPHLDTIFLATPKTGVTQAIGRALRPAGKPPLVVDFLDHLIPLLMGYRKARERVYRKLDCAF
jgi:superfamily II DNA or RNA helicase